MVKILAVMSFALAACGYSVSFDDCTIACSAACPDGMTCGSENRCRPPGAVGTCAAMLGDADTDAPRDAPGPDAFDPIVCPATYAISLPSTTSRYRLASSGLAWTEAVAACVADQTSAQGYTHLVVFADRQEQLELEAIVDDVWVGYSDRRVEGDFLAVTSEPIGNYLAATSSAWASGEPNHQTAAEDCVEIILEGGLNDNDCANTRMFVCECDAYANDPSHY